jgi:hypothetical protein
MSRTTVPRLWAEKQKAVAKMRGWNLDFENFVSIGLAGVMSNLPIGPVVPQLPPGPPIRVPPSRQLPSGPPTTTSPSRPRQPQQGTKLTQSGIKRIGDLRDLKDTNVRDAITSRGGGGQEVNKVDKSLRDKTVGEAANIAGPSRPPTDAAARDLWEKANDAIKIVKQARRLGEKKHGE